MTALALLLAVFAASNLQHTIGGPTKGRQVEGERLSCPTSSIVPESPYSSSPYREGEDEGGCGRRCREEGKGIFFRMILKDRLLVV